MHNFISRVFCNFPKFSVYTLVLISKEKGGRGVCGWGGGSKDWISLEDKIVYHKNS